MKAVFVFFLAVVVSINSQAGIKTNLALAGAGNAMSRVVIPAILSGVGRKEAVAVILKFKSIPAFKQKVINVLMPIIITSGNSIYGENARSILSGSGFMNDPMFVSKTKMMQANYNRI